MTEQLKVKLVSGNFKAAGQVSVRVYTHSERRRKAIKKLFLCLLITLVCLFVPVAHFFLVPSGIICSIIFFFRALSIKSFLELSEITCPACQAIIFLNPRPFSQTMTENCEACSREVEILS